MKILNDFFDNIPFSFEKVPNGSVRWINANADLPMNRIVHRKYYPLENYQIEKLKNEVNEQVSRDINFPKWYVDFLKYANGISVFHGAISLYGMQTINRTDPKHESPYSLYMENLERHKKVPKEWLFIGAYSFDGTEIVVDTLHEDEKIFCIYSQTNKIICSWDNFYGFITQELERLRELYTKLPWGVLDINDNTLPDGHKKK